MRFCEPSSRADNALIALEDATDHQLAHACDHHRGLRAEALDPDAR